MESKGFEQEGHYSLVDVESVDMFKFSQFRELPWYRVHLAAGDCLYIPYKWVNILTVVPVLLDEKWGIFLVQFNMFPYCARKAL